MKPTARFRIERCVAVATAIPDAGVGFRGEVVTTWG